MTWWDATVDELAAQPCCGYYSGQRPATEPTALAALAMLAAGRPSAARRATRWLAEQQARAGSLGIRRQEPGPRWPTSLAVLAWHAEARRQGERDLWKREIRRAADWILETRGSTQASSQDVGHNEQLAGWPWVVGTHSWIEPTSLYIMALKAAGCDSHPRVREGVQLLLDRQLPRGGCNYGNTLVLGQVLRPHVQPTGLAMLALAGETDSRQRITRSLDYLRRQVCGGLGAASLSWALLALAAHQEELPDASEVWLEQAAGRTQHGGRSPHRQALLVIAAQQCRTVGRSLLLDGYACSAHESTFWPERRSTESGGTSGGADG